MKMKIKNSMGDFKSKIATAAKIVNMKMSWKKLCLMKHKEKKRKILKKKRESK